MITIFSSKENVKQYLVDIYLSLNSKTVYLHYKDEYVLNSLLTKENIWKDYTDIFIDNIERDFHHTKIKEIMVYICRKSREYNSNLYISTQSLDVLKYFVMFGREGIDTFKRIDSEKYITTFSVGLLDDAFIYNFEMR